MGFERKTRDSTHLHYANISLMIYVSIRYDLINNYQNKQKQAPRFEPLLFQALAHTSKIGGSDTRCRRVAVIREISIILIHNSICFIDNSNQGGMLIYEYRIYFFDKKQ